MQTCDSTCSWCARHFFRWYADRMRSAQRESGRSGEGSFAAAAATSIRADGSRLELGRASGTSV